jgi:hypothetical protein
MSVSNVDETMPPIIGTAMRCITSAPVPWLWQLIKSVVGRSYFRHGLRFFHSGGLDREIMRLKQDKHPVSDCLLVFRCMKVLPNGDILPN